MTFIGIGQCFACEQTFEFDIDKVLTIWIDPVTGTPQTRPRS
jgi:hypothetical protein